MTNAPSTPPAQYAVDTSKARRNADRASSTYLSAARLELEVGGRMLERLDYVKVTPKIILDAGAGPSAQAAQLIKRYPEARVVAFDISAEMLKQRPSPGMLQRLFLKTTTAAICGDLAAIPLATGSVSLVWSNMALHWASAMQAALTEFHRVLEMGGLVMFSTLGPDTLKELRSAFSGVAASHRVHQFIDMHDIGDMLVAAGFEAPVMDTEKITLTYGNLDTLVADLRATGQTCALKARPRGLLSPRRWQQVRALLEQTRQDGRLPTTAEVVYGHAWKPAPRVTAEGHAIVNLQRPKRFRN